MIKPTVYAVALLALGSAAFAPAQALAQVDFSVVIGNAPPPPRYESIPAPRRGHVWVPGYWNWDGDRHVWINGHWETERVGYQYRPNTWVQDRDGWRLNRGEWIAVDSSPDRVNYVAIAPPPPRHEVMPRARAGYVWNPGYWDWRGHRHVWVPGHYLRARPGYVYMQPQWIERDGQWYREAGRWDRRERHASYYRDSDRDGIPNRYDRDRDGDGVPNRYDRDRDGDGIPNRYDRNDHVRDRAGNGDQDRDGVPNHVDRDRDGDGVPNRADYRPDNPHRY